jgi:hypothetical protein
MRYKNRFSVASFIYVDILAARVNQAHLTALTVLHEHAFHLVIQVPGTYRQHRNLGADILQRL